MNPVDVECMVQSNREISAGIYRLRLKSREVAAADNAGPGRFAMIKLPEKYSFTLRRPFSYLNASGDELEFAYRVVGEGTRILSGVEPGAVLRVLGPLGNGFDVSEVKRRALLVAGGMGVAPLFFLALKLREAGVENVEMVYGVCGANELLFVPEMKEAGVAVTVTTEDGSAGCAGLASDEAARSMESNVPDVVFACGPRPMLEAVAKEAKRADVSCRVSVEEKMACGVGACLGCTVQTSRGNRRVCADGPVFDSKMLFGAD